MSVYDLVREGSKSLPADKDRENETLMKSCADTMTIGGHEVLNPSMVHEVLNPSMVAQCPMLPAPLTWIHSTYLAADINQR